MISKNISKLYDHDDFVVYNATCDCGHCRHDICLEMDEYDLMYITLTYEAEKVSIWKRIKFLFSGKFSTYYEFVFSGEDGLRDYIKALEEGLEKLQKKNYDKDTNKC